MNFFKKVSFVGLLISSLFGYAAEKQEASRLLQHKQSGKVYRVVASHAHSLADGRISMCLYYVPVRADIFTEHDKKDHGEIFYKDVLVSSCEYVARNFDDVLQ